MISGPAPVGPGEDLVADHHGRLLRALLLGPRRYYAIIINYYK